MIDIFKSLRKNWFYLQESETTLEKYIIVVKKQFL
jgi:hypothetical protein